jgi:hypothetical protein
LFAGFLKDHPIFAVIGAITAIAGVVLAGLSLAEPRYELVTDESVCGAYEESVKTHKWNECQNPHKVIGYRYNEPVSKSSGRVSGGKDKNWHCTNVKREKERAVGQSIVWSNEKASEEPPHKDGWGHVTYKYHCTIDAHWDPIYAIERWEGCGEAPATALKKPKTCYDTTKRIGWKWKWE